ncbi:hypothetical protein HRG_014746 [Hirsutella rhossiliensis]
MTPTASPRASLRDSSNEEERERDTDEHCHWQYRDRHRVEAADALDVDASFSSFPYVLPSVSECFCPRQPSGPAPDPAESLETSCDVAAAILVQLHDQTDSVGARVALGCTGTSSCSVKNTRIFQLMDRLG